MSTIKKILRKMIFQEKADSESYIKYLRQKGIKIGERTKFFAPNMTHIDETRPWLVEIGDDVQITAGVTILTHGYDWAVLKKVYGEILGSSGGGKIGNNVFIGMHTTILKGTNIGDNVIIGANSLVNKDIPSNCVAAGNPIKIIMPLDTYYMKRKERQAREVTELVHKYRECYGKEPDEKALHEFFWLFSDGDSQLTETWKRMMTLVGNEKESYDALRANKKKYENLDKFLKEI